MGAGGAGKALAYGGKEKGARVVVANRTYGWENLVGNLVWLFLIWCREHDEFLFFWVPAKAKELASKVGGEAITLSELENFHPEEGMILANTTSVGMKPKIDETPIPKVLYGVSVAYSVLNLLLLVFLHCLLLNYAAYLIYEPKIEHKIQLGLSKDNTLQSTAIDD